MITHLALLTLSDRTPLGWYWLVLEKMRLLSPSFLGFLNENLSKNLEDEKSTRMSPV